MESVNKVIQTAREEAKKKVHVPSNIEKLKMNNQPESKTVEERAKEYVPDVFPANATKLMWIKGREDLKREMLVKMEVVRNSKYDGITIEGMEEYIKYLK